MTVNHEMFSGLVDNLEDVMAQGPNPQEKDLLHQMVKKVLIHDRSTIEIWYALPSQGECNVVSVIWGEPEGSPADLG